MTPRTITVPVAPNFISIRNVGGRRRPTETRASHPHLFKTLKGLMRDLPAPPASFDYISAARPLLADVLGNDQLGDCTAAGALHIVEAMTAAANDAVIFGRPDAEKFYSLSTGYVPGDPSTDQGGDEVSVLSYWKKNGLDGKGSHAILGWVAPDPNDWDTLYRLAWLFENVYFGAELLEGWVNVPDGGVWDIGTPADPNAGHCFVALKGDRTAGLTVDTWGEFILITPQAIAQTCSEQAGGNCFIVFSPEIINRAIGKAPTGFDWTNLISLFKEMGGDLSAPSTLSWWQRLEQLLAEKGLVRS